METLEEEEEEEEKFKTPKISRTQFSAHKASFFSISGDPWLCSFPVYFGLLLLYGSSRLPFRIYSVFVVVLRVVWQIALLKKGGGNSTEIFLIF